MSTTLLLEAVTSGEDTRFIETDPAGMFGLASITVFQDDGSELELAFDPRRSEMLNDETRARAQAALDAAERLLELAEAGELRPPSGDESILDGEVTPRRSQKAAPDSEIELAFNPGQSRDAVGRFGEGGGGSPLEAVGVHGVSLEGWSEDEAAKVTLRVEKELSRVREMMPGVSKLLDESPIKKLTLVNGKSFDGEESPGAGGVYHSDSREIKVAYAGEGGGEEILNPGSKGTVVGGHRNGIIRHEVAHHIENVAPNQLSEFRVALEKDLKGSVPTNATKVAKLVSAYAATDVSEAFAESFAMFTSTKYGSGKRFVLPKNVDAYFKKLSAGGG